MRWLIRKTQPQARVGIYFGAQVIAVARNTGTRAAPAIDLIDMRPCADSADWKAVLGRLVRDHGLAGHSCVAVLDPADYQLTQIPAPEVPAAEVRAAVRWRLKEFIPYRIEDAVVDAFELPSAPGRSAPRLMLAVAARGPVVRRVVEALEGAGLVPEAIDIPELALRNLAALVPDQPAGVAVVALRETGGLITVSQGDVLYLARTLEFGGEQLSADADGYVDSLVLELQRSLDYYESQLAGRPVSRVLLAPFAGDRDGLLEQLNRQIGTPAVGFDLTQVVDCAEIPQARQAQALYAVGGALRAPQEAA